MALAMLLAATAYHIQLDTHSSGGPCKGLGKCLSTVRDMNFISEPAACSSQFLFSPDDEG